ncbi:restriction endonuclease [Actinomadura bangladeshensis]|nr:restriction endonuclease [Actinomadura bangladeshensis]
MTIAATSTRLLGPGLKIERLPDREGSTLSILATSSRLTRSAVPIPDFQTLMRPVLHLHADGEDHESAAIVAAMADHFALSADERAEMLPSGGQKLFNNRIAWSITHMAQAGLLERPRRGVTRITTRGQKAMAENPDRVDMKVLNQFAEYREFRARRRKPSKPVNEQDDAADLSQADASPLELIPQLVAEAHTALADELVERLRQAPPEFLEHCVLKLLTRMGYGGPEGDVRHLGGPGDEGMDGLIRQDPLGLDVVYVQAKRYAADRTVHRPDVQAFAGALQGAQAARGIFIATTRFSPGAIDFAEKVPSRIILIDGRRLGELMVTYDCGVQEAQTVTIKKIDEDFFTTE